MPPPTGFRPYPDIKFKSGGPGSGIILLHPLTDKGREWTDENLEFQSWQMAGGGIAIDRRAALRIANAVINDGLRVS